MYLSPKQSVLFLLKLLCCVAAITVGMVGLSVLLGWYLGNDYLKSVVPGLQTMKANTALAFAATGGALWSLRAREPSSRQRLVGLILAVLAGAIGTLTLAEYALGVDLGVDELLFRDPATLPGSFPGRPAISTAMCFALSGLAMVVADRNPRLAQWLAVPVLLISTLAIVGYAFGVSSLYQITIYSSMALHTAASFVLVALGIITLRPTAGFMAVVASDSAGGIVARRLLVLTPVVLFWLGFVPLAGEARGYFDSRFGLALLVTLGMVVAVLLIGSTARDLYHLDVRRKVAEDEIRVLNEGLEQKVVERTRELEESLAQVKQLRGLLPMCAWCKKIRDDQEYWHTVEAYITDHTDAQFSHGICPECAARFMAEALERPVVYPAPTLGTASTVHGRPDDAAEEPGR